MKKRNKWFLMISSITAITSPIFISAACGTKNSEPGKKTEVVSKDNLRSKINEVNSFIDSLNDAKYSSFGHPYFWKCFIDWLVCVIIFL
ncbi:hypothetical protein RRG37_04140 [Mycoplasmopsis felis]|uniref:hypothetical protein n=1 Tax=Mycoplasmopsis felis TaxID=33923 RepID=UPI002AFFE1B2|nr:hypothetical protein [Mycoplasmopsis felis]WQQ06204.1 hypothetical protein RRG40_00005 [Mycoplasmopsis felis]